MAQVIDLAKVRKERKQRRPEPKNRIEVPKLTRKAAKAMQRAQAVRLAHIGRL